MSLDRAWKYVHYFTRRWLPMVIVVRPSSSKGVDRVMKEDSFRYSTRRREGIFLPSLQRSASSRVLFAPTCPIRFPSCAAISLRALKGDTNEKPDEFPSLTPRRNLHWKFLLSEGVDGKFINFLRHLSFSIWLLVSGWKAPVD